MKHPVILVTTLGLASTLAYFFLPSPFVLGQGSLTPTPATPGPVMKTLEQVEPRGDLQAAISPPGVSTNNADYHYIISQAGSYYLSANLGVTKTNGIQITAEGVTRRKQLGPAAAAGTATNPWANL